MKKNCDFCNKRIGLFSSPAQEAIQDGLCLCNKCYKSLWKKQADVTSQAKNLARIALREGLHPEIKSIIVKRVKGLVVTETKKLDSLVNSVNSSEVPGNNESAPIDGNVNQNGHVLDENSLFEELYTSKNLNAFKRYLSIKGLRPETITKITTYLKTHSPQDSKSTLKDFVEGLRNPHETLLWTNDIEERRVFNSILYDVIEREKVEALVPNISDNDGVGIKDNNSSISDSVDLSSKQTSVERKEDLNDESEEQKSNSDEPILISFEKLCSIEQNLQSQVHALWKKLGHSDLEVVSIEEKSLYEQIMNLDENERACHLAFEAEIDVFLFFRRLLDHSTGIKEAIILPLQIIKSTYAGKKFLLKPDDIISFIQMQHECINFTHIVKANTAALIEQFNESPATDYQKYEHDMVFLTNQKRSFIESILEQIGVVITEKDNMGRISNIRYND